MARRNVAKLIGVLVGVAVSVAVVLLGHLPWHLPLVVGSGVVLILFIYWWLESISLVEEPAGSPLAPDRPPGTT